MSTSPPLIWIDLEMTGLDPQTCHIIEIATIVTDNDLNILAEGPNLVIHQPKSIMDAMDSWCTEHHGASGLTQKVLDSTLSLADAEAQTLEFLKDWTTPGKSPLCGNSIWQDRRFLIAYMPLLEQWCHYRLIDVSTLKELAARWRPDLTGAPVKTGQHLALADIRESIEELKFYRKSFIGQS